jgi:hypothetical protein
MFVPRLFDNFTGLYSCFTNFQIVVPLFTIVSFGVFKLHVSVAAVCHETRRSSVPFERAAHFQGFSGEIEEP